MFFRIWSWSNGTNLRSKKPGVLTIMEQLSKHFLEVVKRRKFEVYKTKGQVDLPQCFLRVNKEKLKPGKRVPTDSLTVSSWQSFTTDVCAVFPCYESCCNFTGFVYQAEWELFMRYIVCYPSVVKEVTDSLGRTHGSLVTVHTSRVSCTAWGVLDSLISDEDDDDGGNGGCRHDHGDGDNNIDDDDDNDYVVVTSGDDEGQWWWC